MTTSRLWDHDEPVASLIDVPDWIDQDITGADIAAIIQGGCASGAYMPAVTYSTALDTMRDDGDDVLQYIEDATGSLPDVSGQGWSQMACTYLSAAVELWAASVEDELIDAIAEKEEEGQS